MREPCLHSEGNVQLEVDTVMLSYTGSLRVAASHSRALYSLGRLAARPHPPIGGDYLPASPDLSLTQLRDSPRQ